MEEHRIHLNEPTAEQFAELQKAKFEESLSCAMSKPKNQALFQELADK